VEPGSQLQEEPTSQNKLS